MNNPEEQDVIVKQEMQTLQAARDALHACADPSRARILQRFFKTGPGEYGEGDRFIGVRVPDTRRVARAFRNLSFADLETLLQSGIHEERLLALVILNGRFRKGTGDEQAAIYRMYLSNTERINNWDLVDVSAEHIVGAYLYNTRVRAASGKTAPAGKTAPTGEQECVGERLSALARSESLWERRIAIMASFHFIRKGEYTETLRLVELLLPDPEDLIHKAAGWMLREIGKRDQRVEEEFLGKHYQQMPRTMLRYAIEKFPEERRRQYLKGTVAQTEDTPRHDSGTVQH
jgi:3-methyladenine DNA glycosylase AlkD